MSFISWNRMIRLNIISLQLPKIIKLPCVLISRNIDPRCPRLFFVESFVAVTWLFSCFHLTLLTFYEYGWDQSLSPIFLLRIDIFWYYCSFYSSDLQLFLIFIWAVLRTNWGLYWYEWVRVNNFRMLRYLHFLFPSYWVF